MLRLQLRENIRIRTAQASRTMLQYLHGIYIVDDTLKPEQVGTAIYLKIRNKYFMLTADHVFLDNEGSTIYIDGFDNGPILIPLDNVARHRPSTIKGFGFPDANDFTFIDITDLRNRCNDSYYLPFRDISPQDQPNKSKLYMAMGYPCSGAEQDAPRALVENNAFIFSNTLSLDRAAYVNCQASPRYHYLLKFRRRKVVHESGNVGMAKKPTGISGGGIWLLHDYQEDPLLIRPPMLVGMLIKWKWKYNILKAIRIERILHAIYLEYPSLRAT